MIEAELFRIRIRTAVRAYHQAFIEALPREVTMIMTQIETPASDRHCSRAHLVDFLRSHPLDVPMQRRAELALERWPSTSLIGLLEAMLAALEACEKAQAEERKQADREIGGLLDQIADLEGEIEDLKEKAAAAATKKTKARKAR